MAIHGSMRPVIGMTLVLQLAAACGQLTGTGVKPFQTGSDPDLRDETSRQTSHESLLRLDDRELPQFADAATSSDTTAGVAIGNLEELATAIGVSRLRQSGYRGQGQRIAILDNGFSGLKNSLDSGRLPPTIVYVPGREGSASADTAHGTKLAEVVHAFAPEAEIVLINSNGYSNFIRAIDQCLARGVTMVLYAQVWEYGGNFDGTGFINREVNRATSAGILWVNAAGNYGLATWEGQLRAIEQNATGDNPSTNPAADQALMDGAWEQRYIRFHIPSPSLAKIVLTWDDFRDEKTWRTREDFDLVIEDASHRPIAASRMIQDGEDHGLDEKYSAHARELIRAQLPQGTYYARVEVKNSATIARLPKFRFSIDAFGAQVLDARSVNSIMIPADNPSVVTVGAWDTAMSGTGRGQLWMKPDIMAPSRLTFADGQSVLGSSSAAAVTAGALAAWQSRHGRIDHNGFNALRGSDAIANPATRRLFVH